MAFNYSPKITTDGLVLYLDAANPRSYASGSTSWLDLSRGENNGSLVNGPTFNSANGGSIVFDGVDDYVSCGNNSSINIVGLGLTLCAWVYRTANNPTVNHYRRIIEKAATYPALQYSLVTTPTGFPSGEGRLIFDLYLSGSIAPNIIGVTQLQLNTWYYVSATYDGSFRRLYVNGNLDAQLATTGSITSTISSLVLGDYLPGSGSTYVWNGRISTTQIYNRALSAQEIQQNYNALKGRYGL